MRNPRKVEVAQDGTFAYIWIRMQKLIDCTLWLLVGAMLLSKIHMELLVHSSICF